MDIEVGLSLEKVFQCTISSGGSLEEDTDSSPHSKTSIGDLLSGILLGSFFGHA